MTRTAAPVLLLLGIALAACEANEEAIEDVDDETPYQELATTADTAEGYEERDVAAPVTPVQGGEAAPRPTVPGPLTATGELRSVSGDQPPGAVTVTEEGDGTRVLISVRRYTPQTRLRAAVARGGCDAPGDPVAILSPTVQVGSNGVATIEDQIPIGTRTLLDGQHSVRLVNAAGGATANPQFVLACANLPTVR